MDEDEAPLRSDIFRIDINVIQVNDNPSYIAGLNDTTIAVGDTWRNTIYMKEYRSRRPPTFYDVEDGLNLTFRAHIENGDDNPFTGIPIPIVGSDRAQDWLSFNPATLTFEARPRPEHVGVHRIRVVAFDSVARRIIEDPNAADGFPDDGKGYADFTLRVLNAAPLVANPADDVVAVQDEPFELTLPVPVFSDPDGPGALTLRSHAQVGSPHARKDRALRVQRHTCKDVGVHTVTMTATDTRGNVTQDTFEVTVLNVNDQPTVARGLKDRCVMAGRTFSLPVTKLGYGGHS